MHDTVAFVHRTAYDFIVGTEAGQKIISYSDMSDCEVEVLMFYSALGWQRIYLPLTEIPMSVLQSIPWHELRWEESTMARCAMQVVAFSKSLC